MPRITRHLWYCPFGHRNTDSFQQCSTCGHKYIQRNAQVQESERAVVYFNPATGEHKTPPRNDMPMPQVYEKQGFERREILSMAAWEKESGSVHEPTNFLPGNEIMDNTPVIPKPNPKAIHDLAVDMANAIASGPFTGQDKLL